MKLSGQFQAPNASPGEKARDADRLWTYLGPRPRVKFLEKNRTPIIGRLARGLVTMVTRLSRGDWLLAGSCQQPVNINSWLYQLLYTGCPRRNVPDFGRVFLMLKYTDITQNTYVQSSTVTEIMARAKCGLLAGPRTVPVSWQVLSMFVLECGVRFSSH